MIEESCLAGTEKTSDDSGRNPVIIESIVVAVVVVWIN